MKIKNQKQLNLIFKFILFFVFVGVLLSALNIRLNVNTDSYPLGIYQLTEKAPEKGDLVLFCLPDEIAKIAKANDYMSFGLSCPSNIKPMIKKLVAIGGDNIFIDAQGVKVNETLLLNSAPIPVNSKGEPLKHAGNGVLPADLVFVMSDYNARSWDSRYFGAIPKENLQGVIKPIITWN